MSRRAPWLAPTGWPGHDGQMRSLMSDFDTADVGLIDDRGLSLTELAAETDESALGSALRRILAPREESTHHGFSNII